MENCSPEKLALISTQIALELSKGKTISQLNLIKSVLTQISATMQTIISKNFAKTQTINIVKIKSSNSLLLFLICIHINFCRLKLQQEGELKEKQRFPFLL